MSHTEKGALAHLFVVELGDEGTQFAGKQLADMGATVVKVEPPSGVGARHRGPYRGGVTDVNACIYFWAYNTNKQSVILDLAEEEDRATLRRIASLADVLLEDFEPGYLDSLGLGYTDLATFNPRLIVTSVTPFGQDGPRAKWKGGDIVAMATGGAMNLIGYADDSPPLLPQGDISYQVGGQWATLGTLAALSYRHVTDEGQHVDVSLQEAVAFAVDGYDTAPYTYMGTVSRRRGWDNTDIVTKDGKYMVPQALNVPAERWQRFSEWLKSQGVGEALWDLEGKTLDTATPAYRAVVAELAKTRTSYELLALGAELGFTWMSTNTPEDLLQDPQLQYRGFFQQVEHPDLATTYTYAGPASEWSEGAWRIRSRAPLLGEHNAQLHEMLVNRLGS
jgi:crotonobetainyl-CoA:carnitine CoA-transferase CaiB-like acyl-CoA transferase